MRRRVDSHEYTIWQYVSAMYTRYIQGYTKQLNRAEVLCQHARNTLSPLPWSLCESLVSSENSTAGRESSRVAVFLFKADFRLRSSYPPACDQISSQHHSTSTPNTPNDRCIPDHPPP
ncbi:hypothetical protein ACJRO7_008658 [Eucalyptus globulus]|uniref:Uncharacterized protein n=1 Tax=Eucalyptus globulus TaxID=34317 RepID=A0ABD3ISI9_EUCGL